MKKILLCTLLLAAITTVSFAQNGQAAKTNTGRKATDFKKSTPEESAKWMVSVYADALNLTKEQQKEIYNPILDFQKELATTSTDQLTATTLSYHYYLQETFKNVFTYNQYLKYEQMDDYPDGVERPNLLHGKPTE